MIKNNFYPLRTIVGSSISIIGIIPYPRVAPPLKIEVRNHPDINDAVFDDIYSNFLPDIIKDGITYQPVQGMNTMPVPDSNIFPFDNIGAQGFLNIFKNPSDIPFPETDSVASIYGYQEDNFIELQLNSQVQDDQELTNHFYSGRDKAYSFLILLDKEALVGGMCFNGYPFISSRIESTIEGMTVGNFGLPREIRLTPLPSFVGKSIEELTGFQRSQFIDSEFAYTRQEILSHSGINYLTIDPVKTNLFLLTITDLPFIPKIIDLDTNKDLQNPLRVEGFKGFAIPYLWFFEYKEQTKRSARLHAGVLGVKPSYPHLPKIDGDNASEDILRRAFPEWEYYFLQEPKIKPKYTKEEILDLIEKEAAELQDDPGNEQLINNLASLQAMLHAIENAENQNGVYWVYTAHSALGQRREFGFSYANLNYSPEVRALPIIKNKKTITECFVSDLLQPNEKVTLYLQQGEEFERCVAGLKALFLLIPNDEKTEKFAELFANLRGVGDGINQLSDEERTFVEDALAFYLTLPPETNFCEEFKLKIYEVDPAEGVSPAAVDLNSKYATLLANIIVNDFMDVIFSQLFKGIPFRKTSSAKYFALDFTNTGQKAGQVAFHSLQMIRSANVSVQPRPAKTQQVKAMHYRIIGPELADDFSKLGNEGFNFSIDRLSAGQTKNVFYSAMSLLDLLHTGGARIQSNVRRRAIEFEMVENYRELNGKQEDYLIKKFASDNFSGINFENRETDNDNKSWRSIESGKDVPWILNKGIPGFEFESYSGSEIRSRTEQISTLGDSLFEEFDNLTGNLRNLVQDIIPLNNLIDVVTASRRIFRNQTNTNLWKPFERFGLNNNNLPPISGIQTLSIPPLYLQYVDMMSNMLGTLNGMFDPAQIDDPTNLPQINFNTQAIDDLISKFTLLNGLSIGMNIGGSVGGSFGVDVGVSASLNSGYSGGYSLGVNSNLASSLRNSTSGSTGAIVQTGQEVKHSLNRSKQDGYDNNISHSEANESEQKRIVTRRELLDRDTERVRGAEVMWQDKIQDIITGSIPLNFTLPATATKMNFRTADDSLRVRFNSGFSPSIQVDFWFELTEETIKDDN